MLNESGCLHRLDNNLSFWLNVLWAEKEWWVTGVLNTVCRITFKLMAWVYIQTLMFISWMEQQEAWSRATSSWNIMVCNGEVLLRVLMSISHAETQRWWEQLVVYSFYIKLTLAIWGTCLGKWLHKNTQRSSSSPCSLIITPLNTFGNTNTKKTKLVCEAKLWRISILFLDTEKQVWFSNMHFYLKHHQHHQHHHGWYSYSLWDLGVYRMECGKQECIHKQRILLHSVTHPCYTVLLNKDSAKDWLLSGVSFLWQ